MASKLCDSCKSATAALYCRTDSAFLCLNCDAKIHAANKLASRHGRVLICEVCEQAPAHVTCKADAASLCITCDRDIHSANPLACRHECVPVTVFFDSVKDSVMNFFDDRYGIDDTDLTEWLIPNGKVVESDEVVNNNGQCWFADVDPYLDVDFGSIDPKLEVVEQISSGNNDCVVPVHNKSLQGSFVHDNCYEIDFTESKPFAFGSFNTSQSVSLSSLEVGMVPDGGMEGTNERVVMQLKGVDREARVMRYREKRKNRKFEKTIRYASRKAYAETRPRIKGRFAKRTEVELEVEDVDSSLFAFGVVPSF